MAVEVLRRCAGPCHRMRSTEEFRTVRAWLDNRGKKHRIFDTYCRECAAKVPLTQRKKRGDV